MSPGAKQLTSILLQKGREQYLPQVAEAFLDLYDQKKRIVRGVLTSARPMPDTEISLIKQNLKQVHGMDYELEQAVDSSLIGGFTLKVGDRLFDGSVAFGHDDVPFSSLIARQIELNGGN